MAEPDAIRCDRAELRKSVRLDDGSWRYEAVLARADVPMRYDWGEEVADVAALSDPAYLDGLRGLAVVAKHPGSKRVDISQPGTFTEVGTVLTARWDSEQRQVVVEIAVRNDAANAKIKAGQTGVSEGYAVPEVDATRQPARQMRRVSNHVALTMDLPPRMRGAHIRGDSSHTPSKESPMELDTLLASLRANGIRVDSIDSVEGSIKALRTSEQLAATETARADSAEQQLTDARAALGLDEGPVTADRVDAAVSDRVSKLAALHALASSHGLKVEGPQTLGGLRKALAVHLGGDANRADSADYCEGIFAARPVPTDAERIAAGVRIDSTQGSARCTL